MFFIIAITQGKKNISSSIGLFCPVCKKYSRCQVFAAYSCLSIFFIPVFRWNKQYYVTTACCETLYQLNPDVGKALEKGRITEIKEQELTVLKQGTGGRRRKRICPGCGYQTFEAFDFCPKCGTAMTWPD